MYLDSDCAVLHVWTHYNIFGPLPFDRLLAVLSPRKTTLRTEEDFEELKEEDNTTPFFSSPNCDQSTPPEIALRGPGALWKFQQSTKHFILCGLRKPAEDPVCPQSPSLGAFRKARNPVKSLSQRSLVLRDNDLSPTYMYYISVAPKNPGGNGPRGQNSSAPETARVQGTGSKQASSRWPRMGPAASCLLDRSLMREKMALSSSACRNAALKMTLVTSSTSGSNKEQQRHL